ncbi:MAG: hypothetical protein HQK76_07630 [Desulfobacterales bacterium]|nr:hypothetical protein [Desulfobacterales bacterium]
MDINKRFNMENLKSIILKAGTGDTGSIPLTSLDCFENRFVFETAVFYKPTLDPEKLEASLIKTLKAFPIVSGRIKSGPKNKLSINCCDAGVKFTVASCKEKMEKFGPDNNAKADLDYFLEKIESQTLVDKDTPIASFKITQMNGGGTVLGLSMAHGIVDYLSFGYFTMFWALETKGLSIPGPVLDRTLFEKNMDFDIDEDELEDEVLGYKYLKPLEIPEILKNYETYKNQIVGHVVSFSRTELNNIKNDASQGLPEGVWVSTNDAFCAYIWQFSSLFRNLDPNSKSKLLLISDIRSKMIPALPLNYFGNAVSNIISEMSVEELQKSPLSKVAYTVRKNVKAINHASIEKEIKWLRSRVIQGRMQQVITSMNLYKNDLFMSSVIAGAGYKEVDFGAGPPLWVTIPNIPVPWVVQLTPSSKGDGGIDMHLHITEESVKKLTSNEWTEKIHKYQK